MRFDLLFDGIPHTLQANTAPPHPACEVVGVATQVHQAGANKLFLCTRTALHNHHFDADAAYAAGCRLFAAERGLSLPPDASVLILPDTNAVAGELAARCLSHPARELTVFGITGGVGKTTLAHLLCTLLRRMGRKIATITTDGVDMEGERTPHGSILPDAVAMQGIFHRLRDAGVELVILELSAYQLAQKLQKSIPFAALLHTGDAPRANDPAVAHPDAAVYDILFKEAAACTVAPVGLQLSHRGRLIAVGEGGDAFVSDVREHWGESGLQTEFQLHFANGEVYPAALPLPCEWVEKLAPMVAVLAHMAGAAPAEIAGQLMHCTPIGRMECLCASRGRAVFADAAYRPEDVEKALGLLRRHTAGKLTVLLGSVGGRAKARRAPLGRAAERGADLVYLTADDPDTENAEEICLEMAAGFSDPARYVILPDRRGAILRAVRELREGDVLLLCGKGAQQYQLIGGKQLPFCEKEIVEAAMARR